ncbi:GNAT family N-acetyltransferase [Staphylococcus sp. EZ-P03]|uniref:GNAT family N-acetyltransferase n=1 Tax=Staphylococcus sp. EZ-P03 TaxID=2282739 RepID=UPI000DF79C84|nr:GNAT family N-acetyltransferase [Staphylococcus sp. EZ-P03]
MHAIQLIPYVPKYNAQLAEFSIAKEESAFALTPLAALEDLADQEYPVIVLYEQLPAGFLRLNQNQERFGLTDNPNSILVKSFSVTETLQGQGIAQSALKQLPNYVKQHFPEVDEIVLSVNFKNPKAIHVYKKIGYNDTGRVIGGNAGPQHVMSYHID